MTNDEWAEQVARIIEVVDRARFDFQGGYPSDWVITDGTLYRADVDHDGAPSLTIMPVPKFLEEYAWALEEDDDATEGDETADA